MPHSYRRVLVVEGCSCHGEPTRCTDRFRRMGDFSRRKFLRATATTAAVAATTPACSFSVATRRLRNPVAVASANGLEAVQLAVQRMTEGWRPVDAAVAGVELVENNPEDDSVGIGGLPNE